MKRAWLPILAALLPLPTTAAGVNPSQVSHQIEAQGPHDTIAALNRTGQWDSVLARIDSGEQVWLDIAAKLAPGSDAGGAEDLGISLATALPRNPWGVLRTATDGQAGPLSIDRVCGIPFIEQSAAQTTAYRRRALFALNRVNDASLADRKARCMAALK